MLRFLKTSYANSTAIAYHLQFYPAQITLVRNLARNAALFGACVTAMLNILAPVAQAQDTRVYVGVGVLPGVGVVAARSAPTLFVLTQEVAVYSDVTLGDSSRVLVALGVGGAIQINRILELAQNRTSGPIGLDVGMRLGPSFYYSLTDESAEQEVRSFRVMFDPFVRGTYRTRGGRVFFAELGANAPDLRFGLSFGL